MKRLLIALLSVVSGFACAATPQPKPQWPIEFDVMQGAGCPNALPCLKRVLTVPNQVCSQQAHEIRTNGVRRFLLGQGTSAATCGANASYVQVPENGGPVWTLWVYPTQPPICTPMPAPLTHPGACPAGTQGAWTQTATYAAATPQVPPDGCWVLGPYLPTAPPAGACTPTQTAGDIDLSYVDKSGAAYARFRNWVNAHLSSPDYLMFAADFDYMAKLDGGSQYCGAAVAMTDAYATKVEASIAAGGQPNWGADANGRDGISSDSYLHVGDNLADFAITKAWCSSAMTPSMWPRWKAIGDQAVFNVFNPSQAKWGGRAFPWSGWAMTPPQPANNYFYSFTSAVQLWRWATGDTQWDDELAYTWAQINPYMATIPTGGSAEGTGYGTSHKELFETERLQRDIFGQNFTDAHLTNSIFYWLHATTPDFLHFAAIGDQARVSNPTWFDYQCALIAQAMLLSPDPTADAQGSWLLHHACAAGMQYTFDYRDGLLPIGNGGTAPTAVTYFGQSTGDLFVRTDWTSSALWCGFRAGPYNQSHAHQDQGGFECYAGGAWLTVDQNVHSHSGIQQGVGNSSTLRFETHGSVVRQVMNSTSTMTVTGTTPATGVRAVANLQPAVGVAASAWSRTFDFTGRIVNVSDAFTPAAGYSAIWQLQVPVVPTINGNVITAGHLKATVLYPPNPTITTTAMSSVDGSDWGAGPTRVDVSGSATGYQVKLEQTP